ncbi:MULTISPECIES: hypothetical protein [unclassified Sinorhizobium]|uniref:hypothetical protein n=1 Tax=unclassified Sinorhizobium TaxID=2613772 RepID=UPI00352642DC
MVDEQGAALTLKAHVQRLSWEQLFPTTVVYRPWPPGGCDRSADLEQMLESTIVMINLFGAVALLLFGLAQVKDGMSRAFGAKLRAGLATGTHNPGQARGRARRKLKQATGNDPGLGQQESANLRDMRSGS